MNPNDLPPISSPTGAPHSQQPFDHNLVDLPALVQAQKWILWAVAANLGTVALIAAIRLLAPEEVAQLLLLLLNLLRVAIGIGTAVAVWHLARSLRYNVPWIPAILAFFPCVGLIVLLILNSRATTKLQENGYRVGLLGAKRDGS